MKTVRIILAFLLVWSLCGCTAVSDTPTQKVASATTESDPTQTQVATTEAPTTESTEPTSAPTTEPTTIQPTQDDTDEIMVWIPTKGGTKYHNRATCSNMHDPDQVTENKAIQLGFTACKKCYK